MTSFSANIALCPMSKKKSQKLTDVEYGSTYFHQTFTD